MPRSIPEIIKQLEDERKRQQTQLQEEGNTVLNWEILDSKHNFSSRDAQSLSRAVFHESNDLRKKGVNGLDIPKTLMKKEHFAKFSEDFPFLFKLSLSANPKVSECLHLIILAKIREDDKHITPQECRNIQERLIMDYAPVLAGNIGPVQSHKSLTN